MIKSKLTNYILFTFFYLLIGLYAFAQKLPNKQEVNLYAPGNIKIDGKADEWESKFQAYNTNVDLFYTMANDDENLYLIIQATKPRVIEKIIDVGVTLTITKPLENKAKELVSFTYPVVTVKDGQKIIKNAGIKTLNVNPAKLSDALNEAKLPISHTDSLIDAANKILFTSANTIKVKGIAENSDTLISVYNERGIKAASAFNNKGTYTYEITIPLKYLSVTAETKKITYNLKLLSRLDDNKKGIVMSYKYVNDEQVDANLDLDTTTDFSGEYTLAKKP